MHKHHDQELTAIQPPIYTTMQAVVTMGNGGYEQLQYTEVPIPKPQTGEVLVQVLAAGVNNTELNTRLGWYCSSVTQGTEALQSNNTAQQDAATQRNGGWDAPTPFPLIQGTDCCGRILAVGKGVSATRIGERILIRPCIRSDNCASLQSRWMASDFNGAFAQFVTIAASEAFAVNCQWSDAELGTIPCAYGTAENMLHRANLTNGDRVLVTGASGGVGSAVVQLAKRRGAHVTAMVSHAKMAQLKQLGADRVLTRTTNLVATLGENTFDVVIDNVAGAAFSQLPLVMKRGGRYASSGAIAGPIVTLDMRNFYLKDLTFLGCTTWDQSVFPNLVNYIEDGEIAPLVAQTFPLAEIISAQQAFTTKQHVGKLVLIPPATTDQQMQFIQRLRQTESNDS